MARRPSNTKRLASETLVVLVVIVGVLLVGYALGGTDERFASLATTLGTVGMAVAGAGGLVGAGQAARDAMTKGATSSVSWSPPVDDETP